MILFGTGGIRGVMRKGEFDEETVKRASLSTALWLKEKGQKSVVIAYDTRKNSREFAELAGRVFAGEGLEAYVFPEPTPTPVLSFAVRYMKAGGGVVVTASHNPPEYNGYKVYTWNGVQAIPEYTDEITEIYKKVDTSRVKEGEIKFVPPEVKESYINTVLELVSNLPMKTDLDIAYSPLHGTGANYVPEVLKRLGFKVRLVEEQMKPDPNFSTAPTPNPEEDEALVLLNKKGATLGLATDPDCDRVGVVFRGRRLTGNQVGVLLTDFLLDYVKVENPLVIKTIVTTDMVRPICEEKGAFLEETPTGFKFIGHLIEEHSRKGDRNFVFGFEESCGYLAGTHARDKDGVVGSVLSAIAFSNHDPYEKLEELYQKHGYYMEKLINFKVEDVEKAIKIYESLKTRNDIIDYSKGCGNVIPNETIAFVFEKSRIFVRPSGTEPKLKVYIHVRGDTREEAEELIRENEKKIEEILKL
ncbi:MULTISPECIES: phospho-sugar mutase [unclassified Thermotoga]|uniref:phospho-sugar mutase n=1 Tax=unclassified Thermotoga TaxID=2631113 RepID=UPI00054086BC|nr:MULTISPECIES: phospho-sugar mutase [unclassified Thermotoga]AIY87527.1 phosphomannomutase [Thermotoga sp. Cell2]KHC92455.1 phosphomannomutase [Thermotoga sp. TBGT1765]KHC93847.1 phosphomannomutase [Thermotoga sp. TBGT1766]KHC96531.1 phosphomannomutase [Thermotoga sp. Xyl54]